jgi:hypothetical protein
MEPLSSEELIARLKAHETKHKQFMIQLEKDEKARLILVSIICGAMIIACLVFMALNGMR